MKKNVFLSVVMLTLGFLFGYSLHNFFVIKTKYADTNDQKVEHYKPVKYPEPEKGQIFFDQEVYYVCLQKENPKFNLNQLDSAFIIEKIRQWKKLEWCHGYYDYSDLGLLFQMPVLKHGKDKQVLTDSIMKHALSEIEQERASGPEGAIICLSRIVYFRGCFLSYCGSGRLDWNKKMEAYDRKLRYHEKRFETFLEQQTDKGNYPPNQ